VQAYDQKSPLSSSNIWLGHCLRQAATKRPTSEATSSEATVVVVVVA
jgi:hypothetical protein